MFNFKLCRLLAVSVLLLGCVAAAQEAAPSELNRRIERQVRSTYTIPAYVTVTVTDRKPSADFSGYDEITVTMSLGEKKNTHQFLLSKDNKTLVSTTKMDLSSDPYTETMSKISIAGRPMRGAKDAKVTVIVYDDFQCPYCSKMHNELFKDVMKAYGDKVKVYYKDFPLFEIHPWAGHAANNSNCLNVQSGSAYWDFADYVHDNGRGITGAQRPVEGQLAELDRVTTDIGKRHALDLPKLADCLKAQPHDAVDASVKEAEALGITGTPAIFVNGEKLEGYVPAKEFRQVLDKALRDAGVTPPVVLEAPAVPSPVK